MRSAALPIQCGSCCTCEFLCLYMLGLSWLYTHMPSVLLRASWRQRPGLRAEDTGLGVVCEVYAPKRPCAVRTSSTGELREAIRDVSTPPVPPLPASLWRTAAADSEGAIRRPVGNGKEDRDCVARRSDGDPAPVAGVPPEPALGELAVEERRLTR